MRSLFRELKKYFELHAVVLVSFALLLVSLIYFGWVKYLNYSQGIQFELATPSFSTIFTIVFASVGSMVALSNFITNRKRFSSEISKQHFEYLHIKTDNLVFQPIELSFTKDGFNYKIPLNDIYFRKLGHFVIESDIATILKQLSIKSNFYGVNNPDVYLQLSSYCSDNEYLKDYLEWAGRKLLDESNYLSDINKRNHLIREVYLLYKSNKLQFLDAKKLLDNLLDEDFSKVLYFITYYCLFVIDKAADPQDFDNYFIDIHRMVRIDKKMFDNISNDFAILLPPSVF